MNYYNICYSIMIVCYHNTICLKLITKLIIIIIPFH